MTWYEYKMARAGRMGYADELHLSDQVIVSGMMFSLHTLQENILVLSGQGTGTRSMVVTTNVYLRSANGWRMVLHHASHAPAPVVRRDIPVEAPKVLH